MAKPDDVVVIVGKDHEGFQIMGKSSFFMEDRRPAALGEL